MPAGHNLTFSVFDPTPCAFPSPRVPLLPPLGFGSFGIPWQGKYKFIHTVKPGTFYSHGRYALHDAYRLAGVGTEGALLAPAYHCRTMIDPAIRLSADILLYPCERNLAPNWQSVAQLTSRSARPIKALLLTHYFGFQQNIRAAYEFCARREIAIIEDCSHALIHDPSIDTPGVFSDYVVASPYKFVPSDDGGILLSTKEIESPPMDLRPQGIDQELHALVRMTSKAIVRYRPRTEGTRRKEPDATEIVAGIDFELPGDTPSKMYTQNHEHFAGFLSSRLILNYAKPDKIAAARRRNYQAWVEIVSRLPECYALYPELPAGCVPYMFPLYIRRPDPHFYMLKQLGVPIWRWDEMGKSDCAVAADYRLNLIHLPCHQELSPNELEWMMMKVTSVMKS